MPRRNPPVAGRSTPDDLAKITRAKGVLDARVLEAMRAVPRAAFVPAERVGSAYVDEPIPIAHEQVTTQPSLSARMIEGLRLDGTEHVLEVGTGYGFQTALLARLARDVVTIDRWPDIVDVARSNLAAQGIGNVRLVVGDGSLGLPEHAPFDAILVSAACAEVPEPLVAQLRISGRLVQPIVSGVHDEVVAFQRSADGLVRLGLLTPARFVRLYGRYGYPDPAG